MARRRYAIVVAAVGVVIVGVASGLYWLYGGGHGRAPRQDAGSLGGVAYVRDQSCAGWLRSTFVRGLWFRARGDILDQEGAKKLGYQFRLILNWERDLF